MTLEYILFDDEFNEIYGIYEDNDIEIFLDDVEEEIMQNKDEIIEDMLLNVELNAKNEDEYINKEISFYYDDYEEQEFEYFVDYVRKELEKAVQNLK